MFARMLRPRVMAAHVSSRLVSIDKITGLFCIACILYLEFIFLVLSRQPTAASSFGSAKRRGEKSRLRRLTRIPDLPAAGRRSHLCDVFQSGLFLNTFGSYARNETSPLSLYEFTWKYFVPTTKRWGTIGV
jgi:hypothetical protein